MEKQKKKNARRRVKMAALTDLKGGYCRLCLQPGPPSYFDFHHIDPETKEFELRQANMRGWEKVLPEAEKCVLLCKCCHAQLHTKYATDY